MIPFVIVVIIFPLASKAGYPPRVRTKCADKINLVGHIRSSRFRAHHGFVNKLWVGRKNIVFLQYKNAARTVTLPFGELGIFVLASLLQAT